MISLATLPLKNRPEDIAPLSEHFLERLATQQGFPRCRLSAGALAELQRYHWPGNVRQLENLLERAVVFGHENPLDADVIREMLTDQPGFPVAGSEATSAEVVLHSLYSAAASDDATWPTMAELERQHLLRSLRHTGFNLSATARLLGWDRNQLRRKMKKYGLELPPEKVNGSKLVRASVRESGPRLAPSPASASYAHCSLLLSRENSISNLRWELLAPSFYDDVAG